MDSVKGLLGSLALSLMLGTMPGAHAMSVLPLDLDRIVDDAVTAFQGRCIDSHSERDAATGMIVTLTTFEVQEKLKGAPGATHTIKQIGGRVGDEVSRVDGVPTFTPGEDYVVFLYGVSSAGFSSPVGLAQGKFPIRGEGANRVVGNGRDLRDVLPPAALARMPRSVQQRLGVAEGELVHMDLDEFKELVRARSGR